jgi:flagellar FliL protein
MDKDKSLLYVIVAGVVVVLIVSVVSSFLLFKSMKKIARPKGPIVTPGVKIGPTYELGDFTVNLASPNHFLRVSITLELMPSFEQEKKEEKKKKVEAELKKREAHIKDAVIDVLSSYTIEQLQSSLAKEKVKRILLEKIRKVVGKGKVKGIFFTEFQYE